MPVLIAGSTYFGLITMPTAIAQELDWVSSTLQYSTSAGIDLTKFDQNSTCSSNSMVVNGKIVQACSHNTTVKYAAITLPENSDNGTLLGVNIDGTMQPVRTGFDRAYSVGKTGGLVGMRSNESQGGFMYYKNFMSRIVSVNNVNGPEKYEIYGEPDFTLKLDDVEKININNIAVSKNGEWLVAYVIRVGIIRMNTTTLKTELVVPVIDPEYSMTAHHLAVSNSGKYVVDSNLAPTIARVYRLEPSCIKELDEHTDLSEFALPCTYQILPDSMPTSSNPRALYYLDSYFTDDDSEIYSYSTIYNITIRISDYVPPVTEPTPTPPPSSVEHKLDYLALGDSYTSGEGDIREGQIFYRPGTSDEKGCHLSSRSYPFLLRDHYNINDDMMASVACSGAVVSRDYIGDNSRYKGQTKYIQDLVNLNKKLKQTALNEFNPGYNTQIEFIKKYQPKLVTVMGGGNDVGFKNILINCIMPNIFDDACGYAKKDSPLSNTLYNSIISQYKVNKRLISEIRNSSPASRVAIISYPSFVSSETFNESACKLNAGFLNKEERKMMNDAIHSFNKMLKQLAYDMQVSFVDIENSLVGGRVCEGVSVYMNDISAVGGYLEKPQDNPAAYHPNHIGHVAMANDIIHSGVYKEKRVPSDQGINYASLPHKNTEQAKSVTIFEGFMNLFLGDGSLLSGSQASVKMYSKEIDLGKFNVLSDGSLNINIPLDNLPAGNHVITIDGTDINGEPIQYYDFLEIPEHTVEHQHKNTAILSSHSHTLPNADFSNVASITHNNTGAEQQSLYTGIKNTTSSNKNTKTYYLYILPIIFVIIVTVIYARNKNKTNS